LNPLSILARLSSRQAMLRYTVMNATSVSRRWIALPTLFLLLTSGLVMPLPALASTVAPANHPNKPSFTFPTQLRAHYLGVGKYGKIPLSGSGLITWQSKTLKDTVRYDASLEIGALFYKSMLRSQGLITPFGIQPLRTEEKNTGKTGTVISIDVQNKSASVLGKNTVLPYNADGQDLLTVMAQLATYVQTQPQWRIAGQEKTFAVYRPGGVKLWRFQSQGPQTVVVNGTGVSTVHVVQMAQDGATDQDEQHDFWLDAARHGFPVKMRKTKSGGDFVELTLKDWQEQ
jgi:Protein of unknown function (DUF3108)